MLERERTEEAVRYSEIETRGGHSATAPLLPTGGTLLFQCAQCFDWNIRVGRVIQHRSLWLLNKPLLSGDNLLCVRFFVFSFIKKTTLERTQTRRNQSIT